MGRRTTYGEPMAAGTRRSRVGAPSGGSAGLSGHGHSHSHGPAVPASRPGRRRPPPPPAPPAPRPRPRSFCGGPSLAGLGVAFGLFVVVVGRWRGLGAIAALAVSFLLLVKFMLPAILDGKNAVEVAAVAATVILFVALYATHGFSVRT